MSEAGRLMFAPDGCIRPNIRTTDYAVYLRARCEHVKIRGAAIIVAATDAEAAARYVATWLNIPQNDVTGVQPASAAPAAWLT